MSAFQSIMQGLSEAKDYVENTPVQAKTKTIKIPAVNVLEVRKKTKLSQSQFAKSIGVARGTLLNWEQGRRSPTGPTKVLLAILDKKPSIVRELLS